MPTAADKFQILIDTKHIGSKEIAKLLKQFDQLGGAKLIKAQKELKKLNRDINTLSGTAKKSRPIFGRFAQGIALGNIAAVAATKAIGLLKDGIKELGKAVLVAARVGVLRIVLINMGKTAGIAESRLKGLTKQIQSLGITEKDAISVLQRFIQANLDVADALKIARLAQDAATIAGMNSSEAAIQITDAINKQRPILLKQFGIMINLIKLYGDYAKAIGKARTALTANDKKQALLNEVLKQGEVISGNYLTAMREVGKQMTSLPRFFENAQVALGERFLPVLQLGVDTAREFLIAIKEMAQTTTDAAATFLALKLKVEQSNERIGQAVKRYEELAKQQGTANFKQEEFNKLLANLVQRFPDAITGWNEYGKAIEISTEAIKTQLRVQNDLMRAQLITHIRNVSDEFKELQDRIALVTERTADLAGPGLGTLLLEMGKAVVFMSDFDEEMATWTGGMAGAQSELNELVIAIASQVLAFKDQEAIMAVITTANADLGAAIRKYITDVTDAEAATTELTDAQKEWAAWWNTVGVKGVAVAWVSDYGKTVQLTTEQAADNWGEYGRIVEDESGRYTRVLIEDTRMVVGAFDELADSTVKATKKSTKQMGGAMGRFAGNVISDLLFAQKSAGEIFSNMAKDFTRLFIQKAMQELMLKFIGTISGGGLLGAIASIFDTKANDDMAARQGRDMISHFSRGAMEELSRVKLAVPMAVSGSSIVSGPVESNVTVNIYGSPDSTSLQEIEDAIRRGISQISLNSPNITGGPIAQFI